MEPPYNDLLFKKSHSIGCFINFGFRQIYLIQTELEWDNTVFIKNLLLL